MAYSDNFPATRPVFMADFANGGKIDPRATFSRASTAIVADGAKHLSTSNILTYSTSFDQWSASGHGARTSGQADPAGGTSAFEIQENSSSGFHRVYQEVTASGELAFTVYAKQNSGTRYLSLTLSNANNDWVAATFDLAGSAPATGSGSSSSFSGLTATQTASGDGFHKCVIKATGSITKAFASLNNATTAPTGTYGLPSYTGDGSSSIDVAFASLSTTGATDYNATTTSIHREYASSLVSKANNIGRFEVGTDGQSGAKGILIESASTNLLTYSSDMSNVAWTKTNLTASAEAIGPDGSLSAFAVRENTSTAMKYIRQGFTAGSGSVAMSVFAKLMGNARRLVIREDSTTGSSAVFDLTAGTVAAAAASGVGSIEAVGSTGWYRCTMVSTPGAGARLFSCWVVSTTATNYESTTGDGYSGLLLAMPQAEDQSFASSYIATTSSTATRAADSLSAATADIGYTGGDVSIYAEITDAKGDYPTVVRLRNTTTGDGLFLYKANAGSSSSANLDYRSYDSGLKTNFAITGSGGATKVAIVAETNRFAGVADGGTVAEDLSSSVPASLDTLSIGGKGTEYVLNGTIKRVALYNEALSDTNLQALTS